MRLSFIIPTYKEESTIENTLKRLRSNPPLCDYEIIVSDASSPDRTVDLAKPYADKIIVEPRKTIARGRNAGAEAAIGDYLVFVDSGVEIPDTRTFFAKLLTIFETDPKLVAVTVSIRAYPQTSTLGVRLHLSIDNNFYYIMNNILHLGGALGKFQMVRAGAFRKIGGYKEQTVMGEDQELFMRLAKIGRTRSENSLCVFHKARRAEAVGWPRLLLLGIVNGISVVLFGKSIPKE